MASNTVINEEHFYVTVSGVSVICLNHGERFGSLFPDVSHCARAGGVLTLPRSSLPLTTSRAPSGVGFGTVAPARRSCTAFQGERLPRARAGTSGR